MLRFLLQPPDRGTEAHVKLLKGRERREKKRSLNKQEDVFEIDIE